jgi:hypothetical protein
MPDATIPAASKMNLAAHSARRLKRRECRAPASPEGCQKLAGGRSASADPRSTSKTDTTLKGSQNRVLKLKRAILAPLQGAGLCDRSTGGIVALRAPQPPANVRHAFSVRRLDAALRPQGSEFRVYAVRCETSNRLKAELQTVFATCCLSRVMPHVSRAPRFSRITHHASRRP